MVHLFSSSNFLPKVVPNLEQSSNLTKSMSNSQFSTHLEFSHTKKITCPWPTK